MKFGKKIVCATVALLVTLACLYVVGSGFIKKNNVYIHDYELSSDGTEMTIYTEVSSSVGYIRAISSEQLADGTLRLIPYAAFGGINGSIGAKTEYTIPLAENTMTIALYRSNIYYVPALQKNDIGEWQFVMKLD